MPTTTEIDSIWDEIDTLRESQWAIREDPSLDAIEIEEALASVREDIDRLLAQVECCFELLAS